MYVDVSCVCDKCWTLHKHSEKCVKLWVRTRSGALKTTASRASLNLHGSFDAKELVKMHGTVGLSML